MKIKASYLIITILTVLTSSSCQNISSIPCNTKYDVTSSVAEKYNLDFKNLKDECIQISSRSKSYNVLHLSFQVDSEQWLNDNIETIKSFTHDYAKDVIKNNEKAETLEAIVITYKKNHDDNQPLRTFEFSSKELKD